MNSGPQLANRGPTTTPRASQSRLGWGIWPLWRLSPARSPTVRAGVMNASARPCDPTSRTGRDFRRLIHARMTGRALGRFPRARTDSPMHSFRSLDKIRNCWIVLCVQSGSVRSHVEFLLTHPSSDAVGNRRRLWWRGAVEPARGRRLCLAVGRGGRSDSLSESTRAEAAATDPQSDGLHLPVHVRRSVAHRHV